MSDDRQARILGAIDELENAEQAQRDWYDKHVAVFWEGETPVASEPLTRGALEELTRRRLAVAAAQSAYEAALRS